ncbi:hypothetical protein [Klebsiella aerogenes]|uniref:hypothetical protein n=1 Tax=Klebsiella aerogenes TaxID=548 RepID=UPI0025A3ECC8|nr:hypothetical protein [Klebsiella aerogenes]MDM8057752.1 hypothetical protein [Klebsiella aerogenes]MDM8081156.1 hypothetical protein [Klebsiella aerogenes]HEP1064740.1 hypothetical protein [Klebsiella aerogenes]
MLINIELSTQDDVLNRKFSAAIENILRSFAENKHLVIAKKEFFQAIINESDGIFSETTKNTASEALKGLREYKAILGLVSFYVSVNFTIPDTSFKWINFGDKDKFECGPLFFNDSSQLQKTKIVCENPLDSDFFNIIANHYAKQVNLSRCTISFNPLNGGGGSTKDIFDRTIKNNEITFCIVDNDKMHPRAPYGGTSTHFLGFRTNKSGMVKILDVHEIESLVPIDTIEKVLQELNLMGRKKATLDFFKELCNIDESVKFYFDHKKGFDLKTAWDLDNEHGTYWRGIIKKIKQNEKCECVNLKKCNCKPSCLTFEGFGEGLLTNTIKHIQKGNLRQYTPLLTPQLNDKWNDLGRSFFSWSCGPYKRTRVS